MLTTEKASDIIIEAINDAFNKAHEIAGTKTGNITQFHIMELQRLTDEITHLLISNINQNME